MAAREQPELWRRLLTAMADKRMEPHDLAAAMKWKSPDQFFKWKNTPRRISRGMATRLAAVLGVPPMQLDPAREAWDEIDRPPVRSATRERLAHVDPAPGRDQVTHHDPLLAAVVDAWPYLPEEVRRQIAQDVIASTPTTPTTHPSHAAALLPKAGG